MNDSLSSIGFIGLRYSRWLDTNTGTFLSEDPLAQMTGQAFGYTAGNPLQQVDPLGLFSLNPLDMIQSQILDPIGQKVQQGWDATTGSISTGINWVNDNPDHVSAFLSGVSLVSSFVPGGQPIAVVAGIGATIFGGIATGKEVAKCMPSNISANNCNPASIALNGLATVTGGASLALRSFSSLSRFAGNIDNIENLGIITTVESELIWGVNIAIDKLSKLNKESCKP